jgi:hypothetical protein
VKTQKKDKSFLIGRFDVWNKKSVPRARRETRMAVQGDPVEERVTFGEALQILDRRASCVGCNEGRVSKKKKKKEKDREKKRETAIGQDRTILSLFFNCSIFFISSFPLDDDHAFNRTIKRKGGENGQYEKSYENSRGR